MSCSRTSTGCSGATEPVPGRRDDPVLWHVTADHVRRPLRTAGMARKCWHGGTPLMQGSPEQGIMETVDLSVFRTGKRNPLVVFRTSLMQTVHMFEGRAQRDEERPDSNMKG